MRALLRVLFGASALITVLAVFAGGAMGSRAIRVRRQNITATAREATFLEERNGIFTIKCNVTLRGEITVEQVEKSAARRLPEGLIGRITEGRTERCTNSTASAIVLVEPRKPFNIRYDGFKGTLPRITDVALTVLRGEFRVFPVFIGRCLYRADFPVLARESRGGQNYDTIITQDLTTGETLIPVEFVEGDVGCPQEPAPEEPRFGARFTVTPVVTVSLVA